MRNIIFYATVCVIFILITFFGLGPVMFADGATSERVITLGIVLVLYVLLVSIVVYYIKKRKTGK